MVIEILRTWYKNATEWQNGLKQVILTPINWNLSGTYQYWGIKIINGSKNLLEPCTRFNSVGYSPKLGIEINFNK